MKELVEIPKDSAMEVFTKDCGLDPYIEKVKSEVNGLVFDISTRKGRDYCASVAAKIARSKTYLDGVGKNLVAELKKKPKLIDAERKRMREILDELKEEVRKPLTEWEEEQKAKREAIEGLIEDIISYRQNLPACSKKTKALLDDVKTYNLDPGFLGEFTTQASDELGKTIAALTSHLETVKKHEEEREELEKLRKEAAEREAKEREERIAREAEERARKEAEERARLEAEKAKAELERAKFEAEQREREAKERELRQQRELEEAKERARLAEEAEVLRLKREAEERARLEAEAKERENRKAEIERETKQALSEVTQEFEEVFNAIKSGLIPNVKYEG